MKEKVLPFIKDENTYRNLAQNSIKKGDYEKAFCFLFSALSISKKPYKIYGDLANAYSETGQFEKAIEYWFKYLNAAPEEQTSTAYEELAVNFFYQDKMFEAGYYFHKKILADGFVSREGLGEEIAEFLTTSAFDRESYHIAYPFDRADFSHEKKLGKKAFSIGDYSTSARIYSAIPVECMDEESFGDKAVAHFLQGEDEKALESCKQSLKVNGENLTAYCNLSTYYFTKKDLDKSAYYYKKALSCFDRSEAQSYQMASCAIEQNDNETAFFCLSLITKERKHDVAMRVYYGIAFINLGNYQRAEEEFSFALRLNPFDRVVKYYAELSRKLQKADDKSLSLLPLKYQREYPDVEIKRFKRLIKDLISEKRDLSILKNPKNLEAIYWGIFSENETLNKECAVLLWFAKNVNGSKILTSLLMDNELRAGVKRVIIYTLIVFGYKEKFGVIAGSRFKKIKRGKLVFDKVAGDETEKSAFTSAYATIIARIAFWEIEADKKIADSINRLYEKHCYEIMESGLTTEEIAVITICTAGIEELKDESEICSVFGVKLSRIKDIINSVRGGKNA